MEKGISANEKYKAKRKKLELAQEKIKQLSPYYYLCEDYNEEVFKNLRWLKHKIRSREKIIQKIMELYKTKKERELDSQERHELFCYVDSVLAYIYKNSEFETLRMANNEHDHWEPLVDHGYIEIMNEDEIYDYPIDEEERAQEIQRYIELDKLFIKLTDDMCREKYIVKRIRSEVSILYEYKKK